MEDNMEKQLDWRWENVRTLVNQCREELETISGSSSEKREESDMIK